MAKCLSPNQERTHDICKDLRNNPKRCGDNYNTYFKAKKAVVAFE